MGQALIQLCQHRGAVVYATVGTDEKRDFLVEKYGIPSHHIFSSRDDSFAAGLKQATHGRGVDVIFNSLASDLLRLTWSCVAPFGRFIELGKKDFSVNSRLEMAPFMRNVMFAAVDLVTLLAERPVYGAKLWSDVMSLARSGAIKVPDPLTVYGLAEVESAFRTMQAGRHMGKLVVVPRPDEQARVMPRRVPVATLKPDASYVLVGGLGGIGRALAARMFELGARSFIFLSRGGVTTDAAQETVAQLREKGAQAEVFNCDVGNRGQLEGAIWTAKLSLPPIRGVVHLGLVIRSALFKDMPLSAWNESVWPKVPGTWNLHELLPRDMDFFVMLSSMVGIIGNPSQTAYGAASTFQDGFAAWRNAQGLPAVSVDLGMITGIGYVAEREGVQKTLRNQGFEEIDGPECLALVEAAMAAPRRPVHAANVVTGLGLGRHAGGDTTRALYQNTRFARARRLAAMRQSADGAGSGGADNAGKAVKLRDRLRQAASFSELAAAVLAAVVGKLASLLMMRAEDVSPQRSMSHYGMDSLVAVEMRNWSAATSRPLSPCSSSWATTPSRSSAGPSLGRPRLASKEAALSKDDK